MIRTLLLPLILLSLLLPIAHDAVAQAPDVSFAYVSPRPDAALVPPGTSITFRPGGRIAADASVVAGHIRVEGERSGVHEGAVTIARDGETIIFTPDEPFLLDERVVVTVRPGIALWTTTPLGETVRSTAGAVRYGFTTATTTVRTDPRASLEAELRKELARSATMPATGQPALRDPEKTIAPASAPDFRPSDYPSYHITALDDPADGYVFVAPFPLAGANPGSRPYLMILDNNGSPLFYRRLSGSGLDFKVQATGSLSYFDNHQNAQNYVELDSAYREVDRWTMGNGYGTDLHELILLPDGHALMMSYDNQPVDMSAVVPGGRADAIVVGMVIQEQDADHNVVFEWRSWDHFEITDASDLVDLTADYIDYVHGNAIERDVDGNLLVSSRHMDEITKIDRQTGEIIWRMGGKRNEFTFVDDTLGFRHQHDIRRLPNGNITLFDNGNGRHPQHSRAVEYSIDEGNKSVNLVWQHAPADGRYSVAMGNAQRLPNGNTMIGWGFPTAGAQKIIASEVRPDGSLAYELLLDTNTVSYRVFRFPWNGRSAAPYLWTEDRDFTRVDSVLLKMTMFGRDDIVRYRLHFWDYPNAEYLYDSTVGNTLVVDGLERGHSYLFRAEGVTASGVLTESSPWLRFTILPIGPYLEPDTTTVVVPPSRVGEQRDYVGDDFFVNTGEGPLVITDLRIAGEDADEFRVSPAMPRPLTIPAGGRADLLLEFQPEENGERSATLTIVSNAVNDTALTLRLTGLGATPVIDGDTVEFPNTAIGTTSDTLVDDVICNAGLLPIVISELRMTSSGYILLNPPALPLNLDPGQCLDLTFRFAPLVDTIVEGILVVRSDAVPDSLAVILRGVGDTTSAVFLAGDEPSATLRVRPLPLRDRAAIAVTLPRPSAATIEIVDIEGRIVRRLDLPRVNGTEIETEWDGRDDAGAVLPSGSYIVRVRAGEWEEERMIVK